MNDSPAVPAENSWHLIRPLGLIGLIAGVLTVFAYEQTYPYIEANKRQAIASAVFQIIPNARQRRDFVIDRTMVRPAGAEEPRDLWRVYGGYDAQGALEGLALEGSAQGYQGMIRLLYSYDPRCTCITGMHIIQATETPGLGNKIAFDEGFHANFSYLDARLDASGNALRHDISAVRHGRKQQAWEIDAISGATVSSKAVAKAINSSAARVLPVIQRQLQQFTAVLHDQQ